MRVFIFFLFFTVVSSSLWSANYYEVLGVSPTATDKEIKTAYRRMAQKYHPDKKSVWGATMTLDQAETKFKQLNEANSVLSDHDKRAKYNRTIRSTQSTSRRPTPSGTEKKWKPQDFNQQRANPKPPPKVDPIAEYLKKMRTEFSAVKNKSAKTFAEYVSKVSANAKAKNLPKLQVALRKFMDSTVDVFFATNPTIDELNKVKTAYADVNIQLDLDRKWLAKSSTRADYINRVEALRGDLPRDQFLRRSGAIIDTTAQDLWGKGASSKDVFSEIDQIKRMEKMRAAQAQARPAYEKPKVKAQTKVRPTTRAYRTGPIPTGGTCSSPQAVKALHTYLNSQIGPSKTGSVIDIAI